MMNQINDTGVLSSQLSKVSNKYKSYTINNFRKIPQIADNFSDEELFEMEVVATVLPFKSNNYVVNELINWDKPRKDPIFNLTFPNRSMLKGHHFDMLAERMKFGADKAEIESIARKIRMELNPHPAGQSKLNLPRINGNVVEGMQHKYDHTALFFPKQGQTCHAYCTFCFRWPQFVSTDELKFATKDIENSIAYFRANPQITDILFTGGDPMVMSPRHFAQYIDALIDAKLPNLQNIRIGSKSLAYWPQTFLEEDGDIILGAFKRAISEGKHIAFMAHFNHHVELTTPAVQEAIQKINATGARIRTQSPVFKNINDDPKVWSAMWKEQVRQGCIPYYMFVARDTGAQHYFAVTLERAWKIFREAYQNVSGLARTVRGPSMSCTPGKVQILGVVEVAGEKVFALRFLQGRNKNWIHRPFFAKYNPDAIWIDDLEPAFGEEKFFFEEELEFKYKSIFRHEDIDDYIGVNYSQN
ncbi:MAG: lysine 2,3-aminomutase [Desulfobulbaceae bacterium]|nr:lysine 2,3-aminomutase [Desulfobulbaceae bacterium]